MRLHFGLGALVVGLSLSACGSSKGGSSSVSSTGSSAGSSTGSVAASSTSSATGSAAGSTTGPATTSGSGTGTTTGRATSSGAATSSGGSSSGTSSGGTTTGPSWTVSTLVGQAPVNGACGTDGTDTAFTPQYLGVDGNANVYVTDANVDEITPAGLVSVLATFGDNSPTGFGVDSSGDAYYLLRTSFGEETEIFSASSTSDLFSAPPSCTDGVVGSDAGVGFGTAVGIAVDSSGNYFVADLGCFKVRELSADLKTISTLAGTGSQGVKNGAGNVAEFSQLSGITIDSNGNFYVSESDIGDIREVASDGTTSSVTSAATSLGGMAVGSDGTVYFSDLQLNNIKAVDPTTKAVTVIAGDGNPGFKDGAGVKAEFNSPAGVGVDLTTGNVFVADTSNCRVRQLTPPVTP